MPAQVTVTMGDAELRAIATLGAVGKVDDATYALSKFSCAAPDGFGEEMRRKLALRKRLTDRTADLFSPDCLVNPHAFEDEGIKTDVLTLEDGRTILYVYDYNDYYSGKSGETPDPQAIELPACIPTT